MKSAFRTLLVLAVTSLTFSTVQAQIVTYSYTGTLLPGENTNFGSTVTGTITLDLSAAPSTPYDGSNSQSEWRNVPNVKISASATNFDCGTGSKSLVDDTVLQQSDPFGALGMGQLSYLGFNQLDGGDAQQIVFSYEALFGGVVANVNKLPDLSKASNGQILLLDANNSATFDFKITATTSVPSTIKIGNTDTGIRDFTYQGQSVNAIIAGYAASAKNHGTFVESVEKLVEKLLKAKLLTKAQAQTINNAAEKSNVGKKPKVKPGKDCKDDKDGDEEDDD